jgi:hypothetical protein
MRLAPGGKPAKVREVWARAPRRWRQAIMVVLAVALPGSITAGASAGMLPMGGGLSSEVLEGILAVEDEAALGGFLEPEHLEAVPVGAGSVAEPVQAVLAGEEVIETLGANGIPATAVDAYMQAADGLAVDDPSCGIRWTLLAAIGRVESNHGRFGGAQLRDDGYSTKPIRGIPLDGRPDVALIRDTEGGVLDGDTTYDRAVGPMQFIPSTWAAVGADADGDGRRDPDNIFDAARGAAVYLCRGDADLREVGARARAVRSYNNADRYVRVVLDLAEMYESGDVDLLPSIGLPPRAPTPPPRATPAPARTAPDPETPLDPARPAPPPAARPDVTGPPASPPPTSSPRPTPPASPPTTTTAPPPTSPPTAPGPVTEPAAPPPAPTPAPPPPGTTTTVPAPPPVTTPDTVPPGEPPVTTPAEPPVAEPPDPAPDAPAPPAPDPAASEEPAEPPAAVGWAPAMREVVVEIIEDAAAAPAPTSPGPTAPVPPSAAADPATAPAPPAADPAAPPGPADTPTGECSPSDGPPPGAGPGCAPASPPPSGTG